MHEGDGGEAAAKSGRGLTRRGFLAGMGTAVAGTTGLAACTRQEAAPNGGGTAAEFTEQRLAALGDLPVGSVVRATYPDADSPILIVRHGRPVPDGVGPGGDIVAYSSFCTHLGCTVEYKPETGVMACPCHFSSFDAARSGMQVMGPATTNLPQVVLAVKGDDVMAVGIRGLVWGRRSNLVRPS